MKYFYQIKLIVFNQILLRITNMSNNFQLNKSMNTKFTPVCKVCIAAGKTDFNHFVKNLDGTTNCPTLLSQDCRYCKTPGHTAKYCPKLAHNKKEDDAMLRQTNSVTTNRLQQTAQITCFASKNVFAGLESDESDEETPQSSKKMKTHLDLKIQTNNGNKHSTTIKTNNFSISSSTGSATSASSATKTSTKTSTNFINPLCQPTVADFPSLPKSDKPNYAAIAAKASALEKAFKTQQEKDTNEEIERTKASTVLQIVGQAGLRTDTVKEATKETMLKKPTEEEMNYQTCGDYIYDYIESRYRPFAHLAGKLTGMIMELEHVEIKQLIKSSKELDNRIVEGIDTLKPKPVAAPLKVVQIKTVEALVPIKSVITKRKIDWTAEESDDEEPVATDNSAW